MRKKIFTLFIFANLIAAILGFISATFPDFLPKFDFYNSIITAGATGLTGGGGLFLMSMLEKERDKNDSVLNAVVDKNLDLQGDVKALFGVVDNLTEIINELRNEQNKTNNGTTETNERIDKLLAFWELELKSRVTNPFVDESVKVDIAEVLGDDKETKTDL